MPNIATVLKEEIGRIARKELRGHIEPLRKAVSQHRRDIASLKREREALQRELRALKKRAGAERAPAAVPDDGSARQIRFSPVWLRKHREKLGLSQQQYGTLVGVSGNTIWNWETGNAAPRAAQRERLAAVRGIGKRAALEALEE
ncbi:MAG TPA: helix-turn-helix transcriptional regulator [Xanthomonadaceae bacterium]|nr:helix-turn-helix transcriptional regulator [Xanthomonadaceae bacterium]